MNPPNEFSPERSDAIRAALVHTAAVGAGRRRALRSGLLITGGAIVGAGLSTAAFATGGFPLSDDTDLTAEEERAQWDGLEYFSEMAEQPGFSSGGRSTDPAYDLVFHWQSELGEEAQAIIERAEENGFAVQVVYMARTDQEAWDAALRYVNALTAAGIEVDGFGVAGRNDVIEVRGPQLSNDPQVQKRARAVAGSSLGEAFTIAFIPNDPVVPANASPSGG